MKLLNKIKKFFRENLHLMFHRDHIIVVLLAWAIAGKEEAKRHTGDDSFWYNVLDKYTRGIKYGETNGLIIGPHVSNLLSELILVVVDSKLYEKGYKFIRHIDDYDCYVETREKADAFIYDLSDELRNFSLVLNRKKTRVLELPIGQDEGWVRRLNTFKMLMPKDRWSSAGRYDRRCKGLLCRVYDASCYFVPLSLPVY